jgi:hypothetical protein
LAPVSAKSGDAKRAEERAEFFVGKVRRENRRREAASQYRDEKQARKPIYRKTAAKKLLAKRFGELWWV